MRKDFVKYLKSLGMGNVLRDHVATLEGRVSAICPEAITHLLVGEYVSDDGSRVYDDIYFFSENYVIEHKNFASRDMFEIDRIGKRIINLMVSLADFDPGALTRSKKSRLIVRYVTADKLIAEMRASGTNCNHLMEITRTCLVPNFLVHRADDTDGATRRRR